MLILELMASAGPLRVLNNLRDRFSVSASDADVLPLIEGGLVARRLESYVLTEVGREAIGVLDAVQASLATLATTQSNHQAAGLLEHLQRNNCP